MQATTLSKRLAKKFTGSKSAIAYKVVQDLVEGTKNTYLVREGNVIRPVYTSGSGRFASNQDHTYAISNLLDLIGVKYESGNDAPRGGLTGTFIKVITKIER